MLWGGERKGLEQQHHTEVSRQRVHRVLPLWPEELPFPKKSSAEPAPALHLTTKEMHFARLQARAHRSGRGSFFSHCEGNACMRSRTWKCIKENRRTNWPWLWSLSTVPRGFIELLLAGIGLGYVLNSPRSGPLRPFSVVQSLCPFLQPPTLSLSAQVPVQLRGGSVSAAPVSSSGLLPEREQVKSTSQTTLSPEL